MSWRVMTRKPQHVTVYHAELFCLTSNNNTYICFMFFLSVTTLVIWYQKKHLPTHTYQPPLSTMSDGLSFSVFSSYAWHSYCTASLQVLSSTSRSASLHFISYPFIHTHHFIPSLSSPHVIILTVDELSTCVECVEGCRHWMMTEWMVCCTLLTRRVLCCCRAIIQPCHRPASVVCMSTCMHTYTHTYIDICNVHIGQTQRLEAETRMVAMWQ